MDVRFDRGSNKERKGPKSLHATESHDHPGYSLEEDNEDIAGRQVYVGNLPFSLRWYELKDIFNEVGDVAHAKIPFFGKKPKGYGLVLFHNEQDAKKAIEKFNGYELRGRTIEVREFLTEGKPEKDEKDEKYSNDLSNKDEIKSSIPKSRSRSVSPERIINNESNGNVPPTAHLYVGNLPFSMQWQDLKDIFRVAGEVVRSDISVDNYGKSKGFGQVVMSSTEDAKNAIELLNGKDVEGRTIEVREDKFADSGNSQVFVGNLPFNARWQDLKNIFRPYDLIPIHADILIEQRTGRSKGCGVVRFSEKDDAIRAVKEVDGTIFLGRKLAVHFDKFS